MGASIGFDIIARDRASNTFTRVGASADLSSKRMRKFGAAAKYAALGVAAAVGVATVAAYKLAKGAMEDQQAAAKLALQLKNSAGATHKQVAATEAWISAQGRSLGVTDDELRPALANLVTATHDVGKAQKLASLAMDISAAKGKSLKSVSEALMKAQNGNVGGLGRLGVATKDAEGKTLSFQKIQENLAKTFHGSAAKAANTTAGRFARLKLILSETGESIGYKLLPPLTRLAGWILSTGLPAMSRFGNWMSSTFGPVLSRLGGYISGTLVPAFQKFGQMVSEKVAAAMPRVQAGAAQLRTILAQVGDVIQTRVMPVVSGLVSFYATQWLPMQAKIYAQVATKLKPIFDQLATSFQTKMLPAINKALVKFHEWQPTIQKVALVVGQVTGKVLVFTAAVAGKVLPVLIRWNVFLYGTVIKTLITVGAHLITAGQKVYAFGKAFVDAIKDVIRFQTAVYNKVGAVVSKVASIPGKVTAAIGDLGSLLFNAGRAVIQGLIDGVQSMVKPLTDKLHAITKLFPKNKGPIEKDRTLLKPAGVAIMEGLIHGIESKRKPLELLLKKVTEHVKKTGEKLRTLKQTRDDFAAGFQFGDSVFATPDTETTTTDAEGNETTTTTAPTLASMKAFALAQKAQAAQVSGDVQKLIKMGLSGSLIKQMQSQGASGIAQIHALAGGSAADIAEFNSLDKQTADFYEKAGMSAANAIYTKQIEDAEKDAKLAAALAKAIHDGLPDAVEAHMSRYQFILQGDTLVAILKKKKRDQGGKPLGLS